MKSLKPSEFLNTLDTLTQALPEICSANLEQQPIRSLFKLVDQLRAIGQECEQLHHQIHESLSDKLQDKEYQELLQKSQKQLNDIVILLKGEKEASIRNVRSHLLQWRTVFLKLLQQVEIIQKRQAAQNECQQLQEEVKTLQNQVLSIGLNEQEKLDLLKRLLSLEKGLIAIDQNQKSTGNIGELEQEKLKAFSQALQAIKEKFSNSRSLLP
ncbi:MAG: hypothetical protein NW224_12485 [Leptolyngbyaceae cyanobacterium bins.302]|nr:hypothetical protein [Leptolyngbyaceae cyanobacterium bins.302]